MHQCKLELLQLVYVRLGCLAQKEVKHVGNIFRPIRLASKLRCHWGYTRFRHPRMNDSPHIQNMHLAVLSKFFLYIGYPQIGYWS